MKPRERSYWRAMNVLRRVLGLSTALVGGVFGLRAVALLLRSESTLQIGVTATADIGPKLVILGGAVVVLGFGVFMLRAQAYRPDLGDVAWLPEARVRDVQPRRHRHWWTGDRKRSSPL